MATCTYYERPTPSRLSVGGKYVYGYNWRMKNVELDSLCPGMGQDRILASDLLRSRRCHFRRPARAERRAAGRALRGAYVAAVTECSTRYWQTHPPCPEPVIESEDPTADDRLYRPVVDTENNLTYLDICIVAKTQGGGGGGGGGGGRGK